MSTRCLLAGTSFSSTMASTFWTMTMRPSGILPKRPFAGCAENVPCHGAGTSGRHPTDGLSAALWLRLQFVVHVVWPSSGSQSSQSYVVARTRWLRAAPSANLSGQCDRMARVEVVLYAKGREIPLPRKHQAQTIWLCSGCSWWAPEPRIHYPDNGSMNKHPISMTHPTTIELGFVLGDGTFLT